MKYHLIKFILTAVLTLLVLAFQENGLPASVLNPEIKRYEADIFKCFAGGDYFAMYDGIERLLLDFPDKPETYLYIFDIARLSEACGFGRARNTLVSFIKKLETVNSQWKNLYILSAKLELERLLYPYDKKASEEISQRLFPLREWVISGPYLKYGDGDMNNAFLPEMFGTFDGAGISKKNITINKPDGIFDTDRYFYGNGIFYAVSTIYPKAQVKIRVYSSSSYKLFINGKEAIKNLQGDVFRNMRVLHAYAREGITIMMKVAGNNKSTFRIIVTDREDRILNIKSSTDKLLSADCEFLEILDYPYSDFVEGLSAGREEMFFRIGNFFDELDSEEAVRFYKKSRLTDPVNAFFYAQSMINNSRNEKDSSGYMEGWSIMNGLSRKYPELVPAQEKRFEKLLEDRNYHDALMLGKKLVKTAPAYFPARHAYSNLLMSMGYEAEFLDDSAAFMKKFPESIYPMEIQALYYSERNIQRSIEIYNSILNRCYSRKALQSLVSIYRQQGKHEEALQLLDRHNGIDDYKEQYIDLLIESGNYEKAKHVVFRALRDPIDPVAYKNLGFINYLLGADPAMDWKKHLAQNPSSFGILDFLDYLVKGRIENPFMKYDENKQEDFIFSRIAPPADGFSSQVLYRGRMYVLNEDGGSRAYCEDLLYIKDQKGLDKWGEYKIPLGGEFVPLRARVYQMDGSFSDSYRIEKINNQTYINLSSLKEKCIVHISYYLNNPFQLNGKPRFFSVPFTSIQDFNEPLRYFSLKIIAPCDMKVNILFSPGVEPFIEKKDDRNIYSVTLKDLGAIYREENSGSIINYLPFFAVSTMQDHKDFAQWYNGLLQGVFKLEPGDDKRFTGKTQGEIIEKVFNYVAGEIELGSDLIYYPGRAKDTDYRKRGTVEDKVILAKSILDSLSIRSYISFASSTLLPVVKDFVSPAIYDHILLYVPLNINTGVWMDFSKQFSKYGTVDEKINNTDALVLVSDGYEFKKITGRYIDGISRDWNIRLDKTNKALCEIAVRMYGKNNDLRSYFKNAMYQEELVNVYFGQSLQSLEIEDYKILNLAEPGAPLQIKVKGNCISPASFIDEKIIIRPIINKSDISRYVQLEERKYPLFIEVPINESETYSYYLPEEYKIPEFVKDFFISCRFGYAIISFEKLKGNVVLMIKKEIHLNSAKIDTIYYAEFLDFCRKLNNVEQLNIILQINR